MQEKTSPTPQLAAGLGADDASAPLLLEVQDLRTYFYTDDGIVRAVDGISYQVRQGEVFGLVGESGCGKSVSALSLLRLIDPPGRIVEGGITFRGQHLEALSERQMTDLRGSQISMIFQQPQSSLNPVFSVGEQIIEVLQIHLGDEGPDGAGARRRSCCVPWASRIRRRAWVLPARTLRGAGAARDDRHGAGLLAPAVDRR